MPGSFFDDADRAAILARLRSLTADAPARWGRMSAPRMVVHLTDQMTHALGDVPSVWRPNPLSWPIVKQLVRDVLPWPKGRAKGPPEAFVTEPAEWEADLARLIGMVERFGKRSPGEDWPDHILFGRMTGAAWGRFCHKHFDHHLRQFGV